MERPSGGGTGPDPSGTPDARTPDVPRAGATAKGERRRAAIAAAATDLVREHGPQVLAHRAVAVRAGVPLAATTYYFHDLDDLAAAAGAGLVAGWAEHAGAVLTRVLAAAADRPGDTAGFAAGSGDAAGPGAAVDPGDGDSLGGGDRGPAAADAAGAARMLAEALLPPGDDDQVRAHHEQLLAVARLPALAAAVGQARDRLDEVIVRLLDALLPGRRHPSPALVLAVCDGAVVAAASEHRPVRPLAAELLRDLLVAVSSEAVAAPAPPAGR